MPEDFGGFRDLQPGHTARMLELLLSDYRGP